MIVLMIKPGFGLGDVPVVTWSKAASLERQVAQELAGYLHRIYPGEQFVVSEKMPEAGKCIVLGCTADSCIAGYLRDAKPVDVDSYVVTSVKDGSLDVGVIAGADARGVAYGAYALLRKLGCGFYSSYDALPPGKSEPFSFDGWQLTDKPLVKDRLVFNWHNFLSGCSTWNLSEWKSWILQSQKQGYNAVMVHAYGNNPMVSFIFNGKTKPVGYLSTTERGRDWSTMHVNDVRRLFGGEVFNSRVFGADAGMVAEDQKADAAQKLMQGVFQYAGSRSMNVFFAVDVDTASSNPQELIETLPVEARFAVQGGKLWLPNPDTLDGYKYYKAQIDALMAVYPQITDLVVWFRTGGTPWLDFKVEEMPAAWQEEYKAVIEKNPAAAKCWHSQNMFGIGKIVRVFDKALKEAGHDHVRLCSGTWDFAFLPACDLFMPSHVKLIGLDYGVLHDDSVFDKDVKRQQFAQVAANRPVIPVAWAHHDDGNYIGRSYTPFPGFHSRLTGMSACGFGIIHWTTRPLDLFFQSLSEQVWSATKDRSLRLTCEDMAERSFGPVTRAAMGEYLERWVIDAPKFARETGDYFIDRPLTNVEQVVAGCQARIKLIERVDSVKLTPEQRDRLNYYKGMEEFITAFYRTHEMFQNAEALWKKGDVTGACAVMVKCRPEKIIEQFAKVGSLGGMTRGEQGLVVTMNTRWLSHYTRLRQALGLEPVRYNFGPTSHDKLAQSAGRFTFNFDANRHIWQTLGVEETGAETFVLPDETKITRNSEMPAAYEEICRHGIESDKPIKITVQPIMKTAKLPKGDYRLRLLMVDPASTAPGQRVFAVSTGSDPVSGTVDIFKETGGKNQILEVIYSVSVKDAGKIIVTLTPIQGKATLSGIVLDR